MALLPRPRLVLLVSRPARLVRESRPDALLDRNFARRRTLYERVAARFGIPARCVLSISVDRETRRARVVRAREPHGAAGAEEVSFS